jgi:hypothetical protein
MDGDRVWPDAPDPGGAKPTKIAHFSRALSSDNRARARDPGHGSRQKMRGVLVPSAYFRVAHFFGAALLVACDGGHAVSGGPRGPGRNAGSERAHEDAVAVRPEPNPDAPTWLDPPRYVAKSVAAPADGTYSAEFAHLEACDDFALSRIYRGRCSNGNRFLTVATASGTTSRFYRGEVLVGTRSDPHRERDSGSSNTSHANEASSGQAGQTLCTIAEVVPLCGTRPPTFNFGN